MMIRSYKEGRHFFADRKSPKKLAEDIVEKLDVVTPGVDTPVSRLSGGNVQKIDVYKRQVHSAVKQWIRR